MSRTPCRRAVSCYLIDTRCGSHKGHYVNLGVSAIKLDGMAQRVCAGKAATRYPRWAARAGEHQFLKAAAEFILLRALQTGARDLWPGKPARRGSLLSISTVIDPA